VKDYVHSSPVFFRLIRRAMWLLIIVLLLAALLVPAPLQEGANWAVVPNPSKSAWFLLWMQELVSYSGRMIYLILGIAVLFAVLPWLPISPPARRASWFPVEQRWVSRLTVLTATAIITLTIIAMFFRGENWSFVF